MKEIGGYFQMEQLPGREYHAELLRLNLGRTALLYTLTVYRVRTLYLPWFICDSVEAVCRKIPGLKLIRYPVTETFFPVLPDTPETDAWIYLVNSYGLLTQDAVRSLCRKYSRVILDNTHCFFARPVPGIPVLYSPRKFFGLPDGAYLSLPETPDGFEALPRDISGSRMAHILGRYEETASEHYGQMLDTARSFCNEPVKQMSLLTQNLLRGIDYEAAAKRRTENYRVLEDMLEARNGVSFSMPETAPFVYPFYHRDAPRLKKELAARRIFIPTYWNNVISSMPEDSVEHDYASHILPLPVDQRYDRGDMEYMAGQLASVLKP